jgi:hypothetical protein
VLACLGLLPAFRGPLLACAATPRAVGLLLAACRLASSSAQAAKNASAVTWVLYLNSAQWTTSSWDSSCQYVGMCEWV